QAQKGLLARAMLPLTDFRYYMRALGRMVGTAKRGKELNDGKEFSATQASVFLDGFTFRRFLEDCYSENRRRMGVFDKELLRPCCGRPRCAGRCRNSISPGWCAIPLPRFRLSRRWAAWWRRRG